MNLSSKLVSAHLRTKILFQHNFKIFLVRNSNGSLVRDFRKNDAISSIICNTATKNSSLLACIASMKSLVFLYLYANAKGMSISLGLFYFNFDLVLDPLRQIISSQ